MPPTSQSIKALRARPLAFHMQSNFKEFSVGSSSAESAKPLPSRCRCCIARRAPILRNRCCCCRHRRQIFAAETSVSPKSRASQPGAGATAFSIQPHSVSFISYFSLPRSPRAVSFSFIHSFVHLQDKLSFAPPYLWRTFFNVSSFRPGPALSPLPSDD